jgi:uncharacterized protein YjiS (DUF1127 family)
MSAADLSVTRSNTRHAGRWDDLKRRLIERSLRAYSCDELMMLSDHVLSDVGFEPADMPRSFWH